MERIHWDLPASVCGELRGLSVNAGDSATSLPKRVPVLSSVVEAIRRAIEIDKFLIISGAQICESKEEFRSLCLAIGLLLGDLVAQDALGTKVVEVYDRRTGRIRDGVRYHQTRESGDIHNDSVNHPIAFQYLLLGCIEPALLGGESIVVRAADVLSALAAVPQVLAVLRGLFWFEGRGMERSVQLFQLPILGRRGTLPRFRYLRSYIEAAHDKAQQPLRPDQVFAMDALDVVLGSSLIQHRFTLSRGDLLVCSDTEVLHGRTAFIDGTAEGGWSVQRHMLRIWVN